MTMNIKPYSGSGDRGENNNPMILSAGTLTGDRVVNLKGEDLGKVEELMIDTDEGQVSYAVVSYGGLLGFGNKLFAIPWGLLSVDTENRCFILNADREIFENAPGFDKDNWPQMTSRDWISNIYRYYNVPPYWSKG